MPVDLTDLLENVSAPPMHVDVDTVQIPLGEPVSVLAAQGMIDATRRGPWWLDFSDQSGPAGLFPEISLPMAAAGWRLLIVWMR